MKFFNVRYGLLGLALFWAAGTECTKAYNVGDYLYVGPGVGVNGYVTVGRGSYLDTTSTAVQNSTIVTERRVVTVASETQANMVLNQISDRLEKGGPTTGTSYSLLPQAGGNAGASNHLGSLWARVGYDNLRENMTDDKWRADLWSAALGYDYKFNDKVLAGLALTYSNLRGTTDFNKGNIRDNAYGIVPYVAFKYNNCFNFDLMAGYSRVDKSRSRTTPSTASVTAGLTGPKATSSPKSDRYFFAAYANMKQYVNRWNFLARLGYMYASDRQKAFNESDVGQANRSVASLNTNVNRVSLRLQAGYKATAMVEPYAFLTYARDFGATKIRGVPDAAGTLPDNRGLTSSVSYVSPNRQRSNDTYGGGLGLNANVSPNCSTGIEGSYAQSKKFKVIGGMARLRWLF